MTLYSLVYAGEGVLPLELQIASLRVAIHEKLTKDEAAKMHLKELDGTWRETASSTTKIGGVSS